MTTPLQSPASKRLRYALATLLLIIAMNALGGGWYGMRGANELSAHWLKWSPFKTYFIPGLILFLVVGGSTLYASIALLRRQRRSLDFALLSGFILLMWMVVQVALIGYVSWLQPAMGVAAILVIIMTRILSKNE